MSLIFEKLIESEGRGLLLYYYKPDVKNMREIFRNVIYGYMRKYDYQGTCHHFYYFTEGPLEDRLCLIKDYSGSCEGCCPWQRAYENGDEAVFEHIKFLILNRSEIFNDLNELRNAELEVDCEHKKKMLKDKRIMLSQLEGEILKYKKQKMTISYLGRDICPELLCSVVRGI